MKPTKSNVPSKSKPYAYIYMQMAAQKYLELDPKEYKAKIAHDWPQESLDPEILATIKHGMKQILESRGLTCESPFTGLGIHGFYRLAAMLDLKTEMQEATFHGDDQFLDAMHMIDAVTGEPIILYNAVPTSKTRETADKKNRRSYT